MNMKWDYAAMEQCAQALDNLRDAAVANKVMMDKAMETLTAAVQADVGAAFMTAYSQQVSNIQLYSQVLDAEAKQLRGNKQAMMETDAQIASQIRSLFGQVSGK